MSNPVFMGHAHKLYGWNECCAALKYLFIYAYLFIYDFSKKITQCLKELLIGQKLEEITFTKVFHCLNSVNICPLSVYQTTMESEHQWRFLGLHQCPALQQKVFHLSPVPTHLFGLWGLSALHGEGGKNCRANYKEQKKTVGVCTTEK